MRDRFVSLRMDPAPERHFSETTTARSWSSRCWRPSVILPDLLVPGLCNQGIGQHGRSGRNTTARHLACLSSQETDTALRALFEVDHHICACASPARFHYNQASRL